MDEHVLTILNQSALSNAILSELKPILDAQRSATVGRMMAQYRSGTLDHIKALSLVAQLCTLEDLETTLRGRINKGERITREIHNDRK